MATLDELYAEGEQLKDEGKFQEAIEKFQAILEQDPSYTLAHLALAVVCGKAGDHEAAVRHAERAVELEPQEPFNYTALSVTYQRAFTGTGDHLFIQKAEEAMARAHMLQGRR